VGGDLAPFVITRPQSEKKPDNEASSWMRNYVPQFGQIVRWVLLLFLLSVLSAVDGVFHDFDLQMMLQQQKRVKQLLEMSHISNW
jgi:hypothetical protein